ncbi:MAG TPA: hypothetical protein VJ249_08890 [Candidatus Bathyarchaeia archaeon]|nr:hypothetical protein [Candidatus Bathyarchaeia archaeon]
MTKPVPKVYATRFFQLVTSRQFAEAERILERVKQKMHVSDRNRGYFQALYGMLLTMKNSDRYAFLSTADLTDKKQLKNCRKEFLSHMESRLHDDYDRGYFEAWADYMRILPKIEVPPVSNKNTQKVAEEERIQEEKPEVLVTQEKVEAKSKTEPAEDKNEAETVEHRQSLIVDYAKQT